MGAASSWLWWLGAVRGVAVLVARDVLGCAYPILATSKAIVQEGASAHSQGTDRPTDRPTDLFGPCLSLFSTPAHPHRPFLHPSSTSLSTPSLPTSPPHPPPPFHLPSLTPPPLTRPRELHGVADVLDGLRMPGALRVDAARAAALLAALLCRGQAPLHLLARAASLPRRRRPLHRAHRGR